MHATDNKTGIIILAAGASVRLGRPKQSLIFRGQSLIRRAAETALDSGCCPVIVVTGANCEAVEKEINDLPLEIIFNEHWREGMSSSLRAALEKLLEIEPQIRAVVLLVGDQPLVSGKTIRQLVEKQRETGKQIVASRYDETLGVPAIFSAELFDELLKLEGDKGARALIQKYAASGAVGTIAAPEAAFDVDTIEDYERLTSEN